ncbi:MAG: XVIPCD domain-containing protein [Stenotrophomonas sp.]
MGDTAKELVREADAIHAAGEARATAASRHARQDADAVRGVGRAAADSIDHGGQWVAGGLRNGYATAGAYIDKGYELASHHVKTTTAQAPAVLASAGGIAAGLRSTARNYVPAPTAPQNLGNIIETKRLFDRIGPAFGEAVERHGMKETVIPSLDAELIRQEAAAHKLLQQHRQILHPNAGQQAGVGAGPTTLSVGINDPDHQDYRLFKGAQTGVHGIDASFNRTPDLHSDQLAGALAAKARQLGLHSIEQVVLSTDRSRAFAVDTADLAAVNRHVAYVDVVPGRQQPLSVSTLLVAEVNGEQERAASALQLASHHSADQQEQETQLSLRRMG